MLVTPYFPYCFLDNLPSFLMLFFYLSINIEKMQLFEMNFNGFKKSLKFLNSVSIFQELCFSRRFCFEDFFTLAVIQGLFKSFALSFTFFKGKCLPYMIQNFLGKYCKCHWGCEYIQYHLSCFYKDFERRL